MLNSSLRRAFLLTCVIFLTAIRWAEASRFDSFFSPGNSAEYDVLLEPAHDGSPRILHQKAQGSLNVVKAANHSWTLTGGASHMSLSQPVPIPQSTVVFPESLGSIEGGVSYLKKIGDRRQWGTNVTVGSASDKLFHSIHETEVQITGSLMLPSRERNAWLFLLNYSNNRNFLNNVPLPGFAYMWNLPAQKLQLITGFPFLMVNYHPSSEWSAAASLLGFTNVSAEIARRLTGPLWAYTAFQRNPEQWMRAHRNDYSNRLIYDEKKALLGLRSSVGRGFSIDLSGGRTFDRRLFESRDASHTGAPRFNLSNGWLVSATVSRKWE